MNLVKIDPKSLTKDDCIGKENTTIYLVEGHDGKIFTSFLFHLYDHFSKQDILTFSDYYSSYGIEQVVEVYRVEKNSSALKDKLQRLGQTMKQAALDGQEHGIGVHHAVVGCWSRQLQEVVKLL